MFEGRLRHKELIAEMRAADEAEAEAELPEVHAQHVQKMDELKKTYAKQTLLDNIIGHLALNTMNFLEQELVRILVPTGVVYVAKLCIFLSGSKRCSRWTCRNCKGGVPAPLRSRGG
jgi:hypothetical protein